MPWSRARGWRQGQGGRRASALALVLALQAMAAVFFVGDVLADVTFEGVDLHIVLEAAVAVALILGVLFGALEMRRTLDAAERSESALSAARGAMAGLIEARFGQWGLTPAEREVTLLVLKGFDVAAIAGLRGAAGGTVRAQLARVYARAGVASRAELLSHFVDDLIEAPLSGDAGEDGAPRTPVA